MQGGLSPPCNPPPQKPSSKVSRAVCKFCHFLKICHFCFYPDLPQKTWEEPCNTCIMLIVYIKTASRPAIYAFIFVQISRAFKIFQTGRTVQTTVSVDRTT